MMYLGNPEGMFTSAFCRALQRFSAQQWQVLILGEVCAKPDDRRQGRHVDH